MTKIDWPNIDPLERLEIISETQELLAETYPESEFTARNDNIVGVQTFWKNKLADPNIRVAKTNKCIFFYKKFNLGNEHDKLGELKRALVEPHVEMGDCLFIDFGAVVPEGQNEDDIRDFFLNDPTAHHVMGVRRGVIFLFTMEEAAAIAARASSMGFISSPPASLR